MLNCGLSGESPRTSNVCGAKRIPLRNSPAFRLTRDGRHVREMANTRGKSLSQEGERRLVESLRAARLRLFDTPTADILRRLLGERRLVNGHHHRRRAERRVLRWCLAPEGNLRLS